MMQESVTQNPRRKQLTETESDRVEVLELMKRAIVYQWCVDVTLEKVDVKSEVVENFGRTMQMGKKFNQ
jgi:hypothetical protein